VVRLRVEKAGRRGKAVTVIDGLPKNAQFLKKTAKELKAACGCGGAVKDGAVEVQGDHRGRLRGLLRTKGWVVKG
jgi:translation initiation factor 1